MFVFDFDGFLKFFICLPLVIFFASNIWQPEYGMSFATCNGFGLLLFYEVLWPSYSRKKLEDPGLPHFS